MADTSPAFDLKAFLPYQITVLAAAMSKRFSERYSDQFDLSVAEWRIIAHLARHEDLSLREIANDVELDRAKVSRALTALENRGLIHKPSRPDDRRLISVSLTEEGRALYEDIAPLATDFQTWLTEELPDADRRTLMATIAQLQEKLTSTTE